ncbi:MAG: carbohydrate binding domain-containing protein [Cyclobacteriaceae bacterium]
MFTFRAIKIALLVSLVSNTLYGQSVDPLTGRAVVNLPLGEIQNLDLSASVSLSHHGGALRVNEGSGNAGMGWNVNMGGSITREVRGLPDDYTKNNDQRKGWIYSNASTVQGFTPSADDNLAICTDEATDWNFLANSLKFTNDPEPDMFYFNAPGISGKFVFGADGLPKLLPYQNLSIVFSGVTFTIKTNTGITYTFSAIESILREAKQFKNNVPVDMLNRDWAYYQLPVSFAMTWQLMSITSATTGSIINFTYSPIKEVASVKYVTRIYPIQTNKADTLYYIIDKFTPQVITRIQAGNQFIDFSWMNSRIYNITLAAGGETRSYEFVYKNVKGDNSFFTPQKPFLMEVKQESECTALTPFVFSYNGIDPSWIDSDTYTIRTNMPWLTGWGEDFFGYYNGVDNNKNIPTVYFYQSETGARRFRVTPIPGLTATQTLLSNGGMLPNSSYTNFGSLRNIDYPTGGYTSFTYEANKYFDASTNEQLNGPGVRVASITTGGGEPAYGRSLGTSFQWPKLTKSYQYATDDTGTTTSGKITYPPSFAFTDGSTVYRSQSDLGQGSQVLYARVKEIIGGQGSRVFKYDLPNMYPDVIPTASASKVARVAGSACPVGLLQNGTYNFPFAPNQDLDFKRGLLTRVSEYAQDGSLTRETRRSYINLASGPSVKGVKFEFFEEVMGTNYHYSVYDIPVNQSRILWKEYNKVIGEQSQADSTMVVTTYAYNAQNMVVQTTQTNDDGSESKSFIKYAQDFNNITAPAIGDIQANAIFKLNSAIANRSGEVIETYQKFKPVGGVENYSGAQLNIFKDNTSVDGTVLLNQKKSFPQGLAFAPATSSSNNFTSDVKYIPGPTYEYKNALLVNQTDPVTLVSSGAHYSPGITTPLASFANCKAENAVYEGFEFFNDRGMTNSGGGSSSSWTGKAAATISNSFSLATVTPIVKLGTSYRVSFWAKSTAAGTINVQAKNGATVQSTLTLNIAGTNQWTYLEGFLDVTNVASSFSLIVSTTSTTLIAIDDFVALPKTARVSHNTFSLLSGITSQSDDRGNSTVINYDGMGRKTTTYDHKRNLVEVQEYGLQKQGSILLTAGFTASLTHLTKSTVVTLTAAPTCLTQVTYQWIVKDPAGNVVPLPSTANVASWIPNTFGVFKITVIASKLGYESVSTTEDFCVEVSGLTMDLTAICTNFPNITDKNIYYCAPVDDGVRTFTAAISGGPFPGWTLNYTWKVTDIDGLNISNIGTTNLAGTSIQMPRYGKSYSVYCTASITKDVQTKPVSPCNNGMVLGTQSYTINYIINTPCQ